MTLAEFLEWEERQPMRYEFDGVGPVAMSGGTAGHAAIQRNLAIAFGASPVSSLGATSKFRSAMAISVIPTAWSCVPPSIEPRPSYMNP